LEVSLDGGVELQILEGGELLSGGLAGFFVGRPKGSA